ncbi:MAG: Bor family protein [Flavobacteriaceae bacterium]|nr:Bor family protein [Flavobacteriaceae bacterium]
MKKITFLIIASFFFTSCYVHTYTVGDGAKSGMSEKAKQHNFIYGLASGETPDHKALAKGAKDYTIKNEHSFVDGVINALTFGLYNPTTVTVTR